jgi:hypothetical protein
MHPLDRAAFDDPCLLLSIEIRLIISERSSENSIPLLPYFLISIYWLKKSVPKNINFLEARIK